MSDSEKKHDNFIMSVVKSVAVLAATTTLAIPFRGRIAKYIEKDKSGLFGIVTEMSTGIRVIEGKINSIPQSYAYSTSFGAAYGVVDYAISRIFGSREDKPVVGKHTEQLQKQQTETTIERQ